MGIEVSHSTQQRLVHRYEFEELKVEKEVEEISIDGGKVRLRTIKQIGHRLQMTGASTLRRK